MCLSLLGRLAGGERERLLKQAEAAAPGDPAERREEMEVAMQQVRGDEPPGGRGGVWVGKTDAPGKEVGCGMLTHAYRRRPCCRGVMQAVLSW